MRNPVGDVRPGGGQRRGRRHHPEGFGRGVNLLDTANFYGNGDNELLIGRAVQGRRDKVVLSCKSGRLRSLGGGIVGLDARSTSVKNFLAHPPVWLGVEYVNFGVTVKRVWQNSPEPQD